MRIGLPHQLRTSEQSGYTGQNDGMAAGPRRNESSLDKMDEEKKAEAIAAGKFPIGVLFETNDVQEYTEAYDEVIRRAQGGK